jgi:hypothetical protein
MLRVLSLGFSHTRQLDKLCSHTPFTQPYDMCMINTSKNPFSCIFSCRRVVLSMYVPSPDANHCGHSTAGTHPPSCTQTAPRIRRSWCASCDLAGQDVGGDLDAQVGHVGLAEGRRRQLHTPPRRIRKLQRSSPRCRIKLYRHKHCSFAASHQLHPTSHHIRKLQCNLQS